MKILAVRQPWAEEIIAGRKTIEVRSQNTLARERVAIYATRTKPTRQDFSWFKGLGCQVDDLTRGYIIGTVEIFNDEPVSGIFHFHNNSHKHLCSLDMYKKGQHFWDLRNAQRITPIPFKMPRDAVIWAFVDDKLIRKASLK